MADYLTLAEVKEALNDLGTDYDSFLTKLITRASRDVDRLTGQFFDIKAGLVKVWDGLGTGRLFLPWAWPLITVTTLQIKAGGEGTAFTTLPSSDYFLEPAGRPSGFPARRIELAYRPTGGVRVFVWGKGTVQITGDWGWAATPDEIKEVCLEMAIRGYRQRAAGASEDAGLVNQDMENIPRGLSPRSLAILKQYGYLQPNFA